ncbi:cyclic pyranopterin monophosphate synthase MoaC [Candidatus Synechococcus calcipolaris G9]|uniref:Probable molybdenum cofactor guanylyltransferase n=1 Tax=Candidatus Synechococcus calcipolaris G9 TaxID=1497997 RepID=A0ABT6EZV9_9SYNE|nr:cyclic pyranopterin monophosphate synthase MoaC [Candidatus Synechococcus calcipolaris]MDG2991150.1 cyclic pyranopterin monophosphate synthase MoaC [Candidatus Synechococcus calcipolaris G9]
MLNHIDDHHQPTMVDISAKSSSDRRAVAQAQVELPAALRPYLQGQDLHLKKGPVCQTAIIAGTMAVKKTSEMIPFCHALPIDSCKFEIQIGHPSIENPSADQQETPLVVTIRCEVKTQGKTGVEMEALHGAAIAALTIYDMCKAVSSDILIKETKLLAKSGGKKTKAERPLYGLVLTGGESRRMQRDKALIDYHDKPHGQYIYDLLSQYCEQVYLSGRSQQWQGTPLESLPTLVDHHPSVGPIAGILTALETHPDVNWLIVACDLAYIHGPLIEYLLSHYREDVVATCYQNPEKGFPEALCGIYTPLALDVFQKAVAAGIYCPVKLLQMTNCHLIPCDRPQSIANINTPQEYENVQL